MTDDEIIQTFTDQMRDAGLEINLDADDRAAFIAGWRNAEALWLTETAGIYNQ